MSMTVLFKLILFILMICHQQVAKLWGDVKGRRDYDWGVVNAAIFKHLGKTLEKTMDHGLGKYDDDGVVDDDDDNKINLKTLNANYGLLFKNRLILLKNLP